MQDSIHIDLKFTFKGHTGAVYTLCKGLNASDFLSAGSDGYICQWQPETKEDGISIASIPDKIFCLQVAPKVNTVFAGTLSGDLFSIRLDGSALVRRFRFHTKSIYRIAFWNDFLISVSGDGIISLWNVLDGQWLHHLQLGSAKLRSLAVDEINNLVYVGDGNGNLFQLKLPELTLILKKVAAHDKTVFSMACLQHSEALITGGIDARLRTWDHELNNKIELKAHWFAINDIIILEGTPYIATASRDKSIRIWQNQTLDLVKEISRPKFAAHSHSVNSLYWNKESQILFSTGDDGMIYGWHITS